MTKFLVRIVVFLLIPCLIADPALSVSSFEQPRLVTGFRDYYDLISKQALSMPSGSVPLGYIKEALIRCRQMGAAAYRAIPINPHALLSFPAFPPHGDLPKMSDREKIERVGIAVRSFEHGAMIFDIYQKGFVH